MTLETRTDDWVNAILGLGGAKDLSSYTFVVSRPPLDDETLEALYAFDHFAAKLVEKLPQTAMRVGWDLTLPGELSDTAAIRKRYATREEELDVHGHMLVGSYWGRLFGGALSWIGADDGRLSADPLDETSIKSIRFVHTFDRRFVQIASHYTDPTHPRFRQPELFRVRPRFASTLGELVIHESRCVVWPGQPTTEERRVFLRGWDDSVLERVWGALKQVNEDYGAKSLLLGRISQAVFKILDLYKMVSGKAEETLRKRMTMLDFSRNRSKAIVLDTKEDFVNVTQPVGGVDSLIDRSVLRYASAGDMPVTILMGQSPAGFDATGEGDLEVWSANAETWREQVLRARHERIARLVLLSKDGPTAGEEPEEWKIGYRPLRTLTQKEQAEIDDLRARTDAMNIERGVYPAEVAAFRYAPQPAQRVMLEESELRANLERRRELANQPPRDNAELGTVGARSSAALEIVGKIATKQISRESGKALLVELFRFVPEVAEAILGPEDFEAAPEPQKKTPGPPPAPANGSGAGAPQGLPGFNAGGAPE